MTTPSPRLPAARELLVLLAVGAAVFLPVALRAEFLNFDDDFFFAGRSSAFATGGLAHVLDPTRTIANAYLPVSHTSLYVDYLLFGSNPVGAHVHSLLLHCLAAFALARLLGRLGAHRWAALAGAAVFLVHPALAESVSWVSSRKDVLSGLFGFLCLSAVARASTEPKQRGLAIVWALLALYSKATAVVLPLLALPILLWHHKPRRLGVVAGVFGVTLLAGVHHTLIASSEGTLVTTGLGARVVQVPGVFLHYLTTAIWPTGLNVMYPEVQTLESFAANVILGAVVLLVFVGVIVFAFRRRPLVAAGLAAFALALLPFNTALPASAAAAADRYLYLAIPGLALALVGVGERSGPILAGVLVVPLALLGASRASDFETSDALWRSSLAQNDRNAVALINLANDTLARRPGELDEAGRLFERAAEVARYPVHRLRAETLLVGLTERDGRLEESVLHAANAVGVLDELPTGVATAQVRLDVLLMAARQARLAGKNDRAEQWLATASEIGPEHPDVLAFTASARLGESLNESGRIAEDDPRAIEIRGLLERAATYAEGVFPRSYTVPLVRAEFAAATGELMAANRYYNAAIQVHPLRPEAHLGKAQVFLGRGLYEGAERAVREAFAYGVKDARLQYLLGLALGGLNRLDDAREYYEAYLVGRPHDRAARKALAGVIAGQTMRDLYRAQPEQLERAAKRIQELDATNPKAFVIQGVALRHQRDMQAALVVFEKAHEALGDDPEVLRFLAETLRDRGYELLLQDERRDVAMDYFRRFLDRARDTDVPTTAVSNLLEQEWLKLYAKGQEALIDDRLDDAEQALRRCLELRPKEPQPRLQLGFVLFQRGGEWLDAALLEFRANADGQRARGKDSTIGVLYSVLTLTRLERWDDALKVADAFLAKPDPVAAENDVMRLREARDAVARKLDR